MTNDVFQYLPLDDNVTIIRVLKLLPGGTSSPLHCTIDHVLLTGTVKYTALSYAWKDPYLYPGESDAGSEHLTVNQDYCLFIGKNLAAFLRHTRDQEKPSGVMWIDAICINQEDIQERNMHVVKMGDIYRNAEMVIVWLGAEQDDSDLALGLFEEMEALGDRPKRGTLAPDSMHEVSFWDGSDKDRLLDLSRDHDAGRKWTAAIRLFKRAWWSRTWVVQEALLPRDFIFKCGILTLSWQTVWHALENLWLHDQWARETLSHAKSLLEVCNQGRTILWMRSNRRKGSRDLVQLLYHLRSSRSTKPEDKIYGVLGLASDGRTMVPRVDYGLPIIQIYADLYQTMSDARGNLDWLTLATGVPDSTFPSWCADLTKQNRFVSMNTCRSVLGDSPFGFCATGESVPELIIDPSSRHCLVKGYLLDQIDGLGACQHSEDPSTELLQPQTHRSPYHADSEVLEAIWMTLVADQDFEGTADAWRAPARFGTYYTKEAQEILAHPDMHRVALPEQSAFETWVRRNAQLLIGSQTVRQRTIAAPSSEQVDTSTIAGFHRRLQSTVRNRRFIITGKGHVGIANDNVARGDKICLLNGGRMPVVLRPDKVNFLFLGETYVHGMMQGEFWPCDDVEARQFCIL